MKCVLRVTSGVTRGSALRAVNVLDSLLLTLGGGACVPPFGVTHGDGEDGGNGGGDGLLVVVDNAEGDDGG